jgi:hypothetical protein
MPVYNGDLELDSDDRQQKETFECQKRISLRDRAFAHGAAMGPQVVRSTVLTAEEEATCVAFRKHTLLPLEDCLCALQSTLPHLTRSSLHRLLQRPGISRLADVKDDKTAKKEKSKSYLIRFYHIDIAEVRTEEGNLF